LFEHVGGWIADARVNVAEFLQGEQVRRVLAVAELVGCRLEDWYSDRSGRWIGSPAGVKREGFGMGGFVGHGLGSFDGSGGLSSPISAAHC